jgi:hypothetical protein
MSERNGQGLAKPTMNKPPAERRARRNEVEQLLIEGKRPMQIAAALGPKYGASATTLKADARAVLRRWQREDGRGHDRRRAQMLRRLDRIVDGALAEKQWQAATAAILAAGRLAGLIESARITAVANAQSSPSDDRQIVLPVSLLLPTERRRDEQPNSERR